MTFIDDIKTDARNNLIATWRYLAYLDHEKRYLLHELKPDWYENGYMVPCDRQVNGLNRPVPGEHGDPISRAPDVLRCLGIDPFQVDAWVDMIGVDIQQIPIIGSVENGKKRRA